MYKVFIDNKSVIFKVKDEGLLKKEFPDYKYIEAAGGLVQHNNTFLFIKRNGVWDIPKGKLDKGETPEHAAVREIEEECGLVKPAIIRHLVDTWHTYEHKGKMILKKTYWYWLKASETKMNLVPQTEEGITEVTLFNQTEFAKIKADTFLSILEVIEALEKRFNNLVTFPNQCILALNQINSGPKKETYKNEDSALVAAAQKDRNAFAAIYDKYFERIYLFIFKRVGDEDLAGDICQETMLKVMFNITKYEDRGIPFSAWLYRIASNEVNLFFRQKKKNTTVEVQEKHLKDLMEEGSLGKLESEEDQEKLIQMMSKLKPEQTEIIELRFFLEYSFKEIADFYSITEANAKMRLYRILEKMKEDWN